MSSTRLALITAVVLTAGACGGGHSVKTGGPDAAGVQPESSTETSSPLAVTVGSALSSIQVSSSVVVSGSYLTVTGSGIAADEVEFQIATGDDFAALVTGGTTVNNGDFRSDVYIPTALVHEGTCPSPQPCDRQQVAAGVYGIAILDRKTGKPLARVAFKVVHAERGRTYATRSDCAGVAFDGRYWRFDPPTITRDGAIRTGTITVTSSTRAMYSSAQGDTVMLQAVDTPVDCTTG